MKLLIAVTHLLGTGHLARALTLARAFQGAGWEVCVASGGMPAPHLDPGDVPLLQLPPLRSDGVDFARLLDADGTVAAPETFAERQSMLLRQLHDQMPDVVITELFPFGRRVLRVEFTAFLQAARTLPNPPLICASIRDILAPPSKPEKAAKTDAVLAEFYDAVLVHSNAALTPLDLSWPVTEQTRAKVHYTGFVASPPALPTADTPGKDEILVSAGGGDVGGPIFAAALQAAAQSKHHWRLLIGGKDAAQRARDLGRTAPGNVIIEPARPEFRQMLHHAAASVSLCGYNTALDVLQAGCPAVFVPFDAGNEIEQGIRADALSRLNAITVLRSGNLGPAPLLTALNEVTSAPPRKLERTGFDGAAETVRIVQQLREGRR